MSRIADALQRARSENTAGDQVLDPGAPMPRPLAQVNIPWVLGETQTVAFAPPPPSITEALAPVEAPKPREVTTARPPAEPAVKPRRGDEAVVGLIRHLFLERAGAEKPVRRVLFASVDDTPGAADIAPRVAQALAEQSNRSVCLADLDLQNPTLHKQFRLDDRGFSDAVMEPGPLRACTHGAPKHANLWLLPAGASVTEARPLLSQADTQWRLGELLGTFYYVIAYTAPIGTHNDAALLGSVFDGVVLVADAGATKSNVVRAAAQLLERANVRLLGTVLNHRGE